MSVLGSKRRGNSQASPQIRMKAAVALSRANDSGAHSPGEGSTVHLSHSVWSMDLEVILTEMQILSQLSNLGLAFSCLDFLICKMGTVKGP